MSLRKRYLYVLLFGVPGFFVAAISSLFLFGGLIGILWLFILGDNQWPAFTQTLLASLAVLTFLMLWISSMILGYRAGQRLEMVPGWNRSHILLSAGLTALFILFVLFQQWSVGTFGPKSDSMLCNDYCISQGYSGSGTPPQNSGDRTCTCYDESGDEALTVPIDQLSSDPAK